MNRTRLLTLCAFLMASGALSAAPVIGGVTTLAFDPTNLATLSGFFSFGVVPPTTVTVVTGVPTASFPITGGDTSTGIFTHSGGLTLMATGTPRNAGLTSTLQNFIVNLPAGSVTAEAILSGGSMPPTKVPNFQPFDISRADALTVSPALASFYTSEFGLPNLAGQVFGTATISPIVATNTPEPSSIALLGAGLCVGGLLGSRRKRKAASKNLWHESC